MTKARDLADTVATGGAGTGIIRYKYQ